MEEAESILTSRVKRFLCVVTLLIRVEKQLSPF
jgi:hypothetical protein